ncbi:MAG: arsenate reductase ArsC, partial [Vicinamibacterales bacterium]
ILAEAIINQRAISGGTFRGFSAGSRPTGAVHPLALELLEAQHFPTAGLRSKSWDEFNGVDSPRLHFVFTVCDKAAAGACPIWPGQPMTAHWGVADPAAVTGSPDVQRRAFRDVFWTLTRRITLLACLPGEKLGGLALQQRLDEIGQQ